MGGWTGRRGAALMAVSMLASGCIPGSIDRTAAPAPPQAELAREASGADAVEALPAPPPAWETRRVAADARAIDPSTYTVAAGDTLRAIADRTGSGSEAIARANALSPPFTIFPGQRLAIPGGRYHLVRAGETGIAIARAYGVDWSRVVTANALEEPYILRTGRRVLIPDDAAPRGRAERAAAFSLDVDDILTGGEPAIAESSSPARPVASARRVLPSSVAVAEPARRRGGLAWPVEGPVVRRFGPGRSGERNNGIAIAVPIATPIKAAADGTVAYVGSDIPSLGGLVILRHGDGLTSVYGHAGTLMVQRGQAVKRGQTIGLSGESGAADQPELHFELRQGRRPVDPLSRLPARS